MPTFAEGDRVFVYMPVARSGKAYKQSRPFHGPYRIVKLFENGAAVRPVDKPCGDPIRVAFTDFEFVLMRYLMNFGQQEKKGRDM